MINKGLLSLLVLLSGTAGLAYAADKYTPCLDYFTVGPSGCGPVKPKKQSPTTAPEASLPPPVLEEAPTPAPSLAPAPKTLDQKVDEFLENHGKPPREFVEFNLEPTLQNALKWVHAYNKMMDRNMQLTRAWTQAEKIYDQANSQGQDLTQTVESKYALPDVPDYGVPVPEFNFLQDKMKDALANTPRALPGGIAPMGIQQAQPAIPQPTAASLGNISGLDLGKAMQGILPADQNPAAALTAARAPRPDGRIGANVGAIHIDYYFSAECEYCKKFEPEFKQLMTELGDKVEVTCVDATPSGQSIANINGKLDCAWRAVTPGEIQKMGIKATPSLMVSRGPGMPLERVSGYVEPEKLKNYLLNGAKQ
ncbi:MAG: thioredoxin family protein [Alphaproteobacteria bacterium]